MSITSESKAIPTPGERLKARAEAIRMPQRLIAEHAKLPEDTVSRVFLGKNSGQGTTLGAIDEVLRSEELRLRDHLLRLHPVTQ